MKALIKKVETTHPGNLVKQFMLISVYRSFDSFAEFCTLKNISGDAKKELDALVIAHITSTAINSVQKRYYNRKYKRQFTHRIIDKWTAQIIKTHYKGPNRRGRTRVEDLHGRIIDKWISDLVK